MDFCLVTKLGWTKTTHATNIVSYKQPAGCGFSFYVDDTGTTTARIKGVEYPAGVLLSQQMGIFPTETQQAGGLYVYKSSTADGTQRAYFFWGDTKTFHMFTWHGAFNNFLSFGDALSLRYPNAEAGCCYIISNHIAAPTATTTVGLQNGTTTYWTNQNGHFFARGITGLGGSMGMSKYPQDLARHRLAIYELGNWGIPYPSLQEGGMILSKIFLVDNFWGPRAVMRGILVPCHARPVAQGEMIYGQAGTNIEGKTFEMLYGAQDGCILAECTDTFNNAP
jgi:hypothetical protein